MYYLYHIPGRKIGVTNDVEGRVVNQQGYDWDECDILAMDEDISHISDLELELQKKWVIELTKNFTRIFLITIINN